MVSSKAKKAKRPVSLRDVIRGRIEKQRKARLTVKSTHEPDDVVDLSRVEVSPTSEAKDETSKKRGSSTEGQTNKDNSTPRRMSTRSSVGQKPESKEAVVNRRSSNGTMDNEKRKPGDVEREAVKDVNNLCEFFLALEYVDEKGKTMVKYAPWSH